MQGTLLLLPFICIFFFCSFLSTSSFGQEDLHIIQSDGNGLLVEYTPQYDAPETFSINDSKVTRYAFNRYFNHSNQTIGTPEILMCSFTIRFPGLVGNTVEVVNIDYEEIPNVMLAPVPSYREGDAGLIPEYFFNDGAYNISGYLPVSVAALDHIGETRGIFLGSLIFTPLQYDAARKTIRKYNRIVARVNFGISESPTKSASKIKSKAINDDAFQSVESGLSISKEAGLDSSVLSKGSWYRFNVTEDGMYKLTGQALLNAGLPSSADPRTIGIYSNGGIEPPMNPQSPYVDDLTQNNILIFDLGTSGQLDANDYIIFYGKSTRGWNYNASTKAYSHYANHYIDKTDYWLTYSNGENELMTEVPSLSQSNPYRPTTVEARVFREDDKTNVFSSGIEWLGESFISGGQIVYRHQLPGLDVTQPIRYKFNLGAISDQSSYFSVYEHDSLLATAYVYGTSYEYQNYYNTTVTAPSDPNRLPNFSEEQSQLRIRYTTASSGGRGYLDWYEIIYKRLLKAQNDQFSFHTQDTSGVVEYSISGFSGGQVFIFDVTKFDDVQDITNPVVSSDTCTFQIELTSGSVHEIYVVGQNGFKTPGSLSNVTNQNLHGDPSEAEYIIITHSDFMSAAQRLSEYRNKLSKQPLTTLVVDIDKIYNEFGGGTPTPVAVRNYLRYVYLNWTSPPKYVLLFGDGDFDYKRVLGSTTPNWIPPWESTESFNQLGTYASDDFYSIFFSGARVNIGVGRLPVRSIQEANIIVDKIIDYETNGIHDPWKLRFTFVADDGPQAPDRNDDTIHMDHAEGIAAMVPSLFEKKKIYLYEYPTEYTSGGRRKPTANKAIQNAINQGTLVLNFAGHGNPRLWTHEAVFVRESDFPLLNNQGKYFFLVAATCNYAHFDMLNETSSGEILTLMKNAGAIGVFSALRPVYADANYALNVDLFSHLIDTTHFGRMRPQCLGDIIYSTKQHINDYTNDRKYFLIGDPGLRIEFPEFIASVDSINHIGSGGVVQMKALGKSSISGTVRDTSTYLPVGYTGRARIVVYDADRFNTIEEPEFSRPFQYKSSGSVLFRGQDSIIDGKMYVEFIVPKDISYSTEKGRVVIYFSNDSSDGGGYTTNIRITGTDTTAPVDTKGPSVRLYLDRRSFRPGDIVSASPLLIADISDSSGVNTSGAGIGHRLEAWIDNNSESIDLSEYYQSKVGIYTEGSLEYPLGEISNGTHTLRIRVWDTYNNPSMEETMFNVITGAGLQLFNVYNYPNPFSSATVFTFEHNQITTIDVDVRIYTVAGRMIQSLKVQNVTDRFVRVPWDGRDRDGDHPANGVYLYKVVAKTLDGRFTSESFGKLSIMR